VLMAPQTLLGVRDDAGGEFAPPLHVKTGPDGGFAIAKVPPGRYRVSASAPGYQPGSLVDVLVVAGVAKGGLELRLHAGGHALTGTVTDVGGGAIAGVLVSAVRITTGAIMGGGDAPVAGLTDEHGAYRLDLADGAYSVTASHADYVTGSDSISVHAAATLDFVLTPGGSIQGVVLSRADRQPIAGALVRAQGGRASMEHLGGLDDVVAALGGGGVMTDAQGRFTLRGLGSGTLELSAQARGVATREPVPVELGIGEAVEGVEILVDASRSISGYVVRASAPGSARGTTSGLAGVLVGGIQLKNGIAPTVFDESDETGYFEIHGLQKGRYGLVAAKDGLLPSVMQKIVDIGDKDVDDVLLVVDVGTTLRGRVEPAGPASLSLQLDTKDLGLSNIMSMVGAALVHGATRDDGSFELHGVPQGAFTLVARTEDGRKGELPVVVKLEDVDGLVVKLEARAAISGEVVDESGKPLAGVDIDVDALEQKREIVDIGAEMGGGVRSGADGKWSAVGLEPGKYRIQARDEEGRLELRPEGTKPPEVEVAAGEKKAGVRLVVESLDGVIKGRVLGPDGQPVGDAWVVARSAQSWGRMRAQVAEEGGEDAAKSLDAAKGADASEAEAEAPSSSGRSGVRPVLTDDAGRFTITRLRGGDSYDVTAEARGARGFKRGVKPGTDVTIKLAVVSHLTGRVTVAGAPLVDYRLSVDGPRDQQKHVQDAEGRYAIGGLDPGTYDVRVTANEGGVKGKVVIEAGKDATLDLAIEAWGEVSGTIVDALTGKPLSGAAVVASSHELDDAGEQAMGLITGDGPRTDDAGRFHVGKLGPGRGELFAFAGILGGFEPVVNESFELKAGEKKDLGVLKAMTKKKVDEAQRGELGMTCDAGTGVGGDAGVGGGAGKLVVSAVVAGGPAAAAGVAVGDEIVSVEGYPVAQVGAGVARMLLESDRVQVGQAVHLGLLRGGQPVEAVVTARAASGG
jgi:hypothetical protein